MGEKGITNKKNILFINLLFYVQIIFSSLLLLYQKKG